MQYLKEQEDTAPTSQGWLQQHERSSIFAIRILVALTLLLGRFAGRALMALGMCYYLLAAGSARRASRKYLTRVLGYKPGLAQIYNHFYTFSTVLLDRLFFLKDQKDRFDIRLFGEDVLIEALESGKGHVLMGGHMGSFEALRAIGRERPVNINIVMYEDNARNITTMAKAIDPELAKRIIALGRFDSMLRVAQSLDRGEWAGVLADRALTREGLQRMSFLGESASFPIAPFRMVAMLKHEVLFMVALYRGANRYDLHFEKLIDAQELKRRDREVAVREWMQHYAQRLEFYCKQAPYNWFNFFDFWDEHSKED